MKRRLVPAIGLAMACVLSLPTLHAQTKWDLAAAYPATNFHTENLVQFAKDVEAATGGKLKITVHANAALFKAPEIKRSVQGGQAQMGEILLPNFENEWKIFGLDGQPFVATSYAESFKLYQAQKSTLQKKFDSQGMVLLYSVAWPPQGIFTKKPINSAADLKGIKWRAYSPATARIAELVGAQPVTVQAAEFSQALATGVVEATMTSSATGVDSKLYEQLKYYYDTQAWLPKNALLVNKKSFAALSKTEQDAVLKAADGAEKRGWAMSEKVTAETLAKLKSEGMQVLPPSAQLKADLTKVGDTMLKEWLDKSGAEGKAIIDTYRK